MLSAKTRKKIIASLAIATVIGVSAGTGQLVPVINAVSGTNWQEHYRSGHVNINSGTQTMAFSGYTKPAYKDYMIYDDNQPYCKDITINISETTTDWHTLEGGGFLVNVKGSESAKYGYLILFEKSGISLYQLNGANLAGTTTISGQGSKATKIASATKSGSNHQLRIETNPTHIKVTDNGNVIIDKDISNTGGCGFGPLVSYESHDCSSISKITFSNLKLRSQYKNSNGEIVWKNITIGQGVDLNGPEINLSLANSAWNNSGTNVRINATDEESSVAKIECPNGQVINGGSGTWTAPANGNYTFKVYDSAGNYSTRSIKVNNIDKTQPSIGSVSIQNKNGNGFDAIVSGVGDANSGVKAVQFKVWTTSNGQDDIKTVNAVNQGNGTWKAHINKSDHKNEAGEYQVLATSIDNANNSKNSGTVKTILDNTPPAITASYNVPTGWTNQDITVSINAKDTDTGVKNITLPDGTVVNGSSATFKVSNNGTYTVKSQDQAGNVATKNVVIGDGNGSSGIRIDKTLPNLEVNYKHPDGWVNTNLTITAVASDSESGIKNITLPDGTVVNGTSATFDATKNGTYTFKVTDNAGNETVKSIEVTEIDKSVPKEPSFSNLSAESQEEWKVQDFTPDVSTSDDGTLCGIKEVQYQVKNKETGNIIHDWQTFTPNNTKITDEGVLTVSYRTVTKAGTPSNAVETTCKLDKSKPSIKVTNITPADSLRDGLDYRFNADDVISGVKSITLPDGTIVGKNSVEVTIPKAGKYKALVTDVAGNVNEVTFDVPVGTNTHRTKIIDDLSHILDNLSPTNKTVPKDVINLATGNLNNPNYTVTIEDWDLDKSTEDDLGHLSGKVLVTDKQNNVIKVPFNKDVPKVIQTASSAIDRMKLHLGELHANNDTKAIDMIDQMRPYILNPELKLDVEDFKLIPATEDVVGKCTGVYTVTDKAGKVEKLPYEVEIPKLIQTVDTAKDRLLANIGKIVVNNDTVEDDILRQVKPYILNDKLTVKIENFEKKKSTEDDLGLVKCDIIVTDDTGKCDVINFEESISKINQTLKSARDRLMYSLSNLTGDNDTLKYDLIKQARGCIINHSLNLDIDNFMKLRATDESTGKLTGIFVITDEETGEMEEVPYTIEIDKLDKAPDYSNYLTKNDETDGSSVGKPELSILTDDTEEGLGILEKSKSIFSNLPKTEGIGLISIGVSLVSLISICIYALIRKLRKK